MLYLKLSLSINTEILERVKLSRKFKEFKNGGGGGGGGADTKDECLKSFKVFCLQERKKNKKKSTIQLSMVNE